MGAGQGPGKGMMNHRKTSKELDKCGCCSRLGEPLDPIGNVELVKIEAGKT